MEYNVNKPGTGQHRTARCRGSEGDTMVYAPGLVWTLIVLHLDGACGV